jgi:putative membrane protein (TIGR04086 family)
MFMSLKSVINVMFATAIAYVSVFILLLVMNLISFKNADPEQYINMFAYAAFFLGALLCGFINVKVSASGGITAGIAAGLVYTGVIYMLSLLFKGERGFMERLVINIIAVAMAAAGGYIGAYKRPKKVSPAKSRASVRKKYLNKRT